MDKIVDARGFACPKPVMMAKEALKEMGEGMLTVLVDNEIAVKNVTKLGSHLGCAPTSSKKSEKEYEIVFHVSGVPETAGQTGENGNAAAANAESVMAASLSDGIKKGLVAVIASDQMGAGDGELGRILMKGFIFALTKLDELPEAVLLYNGGAKLAAEGSESIEDLKSLESQGVEILTCGTCLNFYGLSEKLAVGSVTNMYEIAERLAGAGNVVRP